MQLISLAVPLYLLAFSLLVSQVPRDFAVVSLVLCAEMALELVLSGQPVTLTPARGAIYVAIVFTVFLPLMVRLCI